MSGMPDTWPLFVEQAGAMFGGQQPQQANDESAVLGAWALDAQSVWNATLSVAASMATGEVRYGWPTLAHRVRGISEAAAKRQGKRPQLSGQAPMPARVSEAERERILRESGATAMLERLRGPATFRANQGEPVPPAPEPELVIDDGERELIERTRGRVLAALGTPGREDGEPA